MALAASASAGSGEGLPLWGGSGYGGESWGGYAYGGGYGGVGVGGRRTGAFGLGEPGRGPDRGRGRFPRELRGHQVAPAPSVELEVGALRGARAGPQVRQLAAAPGAPGGGIDFRLIFAYLLPEGEGHVHDAPAEGDPGLPEPVHRAQGLRPDHRGDRRPLRPELARHRPQAPQQPPEERAREAGLEPQPRPRARADRGHRPSDGAAAPRPGGRRLPHRGHHRERDDLRARGHGRAAARPTSCRSRATR